MNECINNNKNKSNSDNENKSKNANNNMYGTKKQYEWLNEWITMLEIYEGGNVYTWTFYYLTTWHASTSYPLCMNKQNKITTLTILTKPVSYEIAENIYCILIPLSILASSAGDGGSS